MDTHPAEQALRQDAIRRRLQGERRCDICRDLGRSLRWFSKWWGRYQRRPQTDFGDRSRAPHTLPRRTLPHVEQAVITIRRLFETADTPQTKYGLIGHRAIWAELQRLQVTPVPRLATIQRILSRHGLTHPRGAAAATTYYPEPLACVPHAIHATAIITRHLHGGTVVQNFHTFDHYTHAVHLSQHPRKTSGAALTHLLESWVALGLPALQQFDNEEAFCGGHTHRRVIGQVIRLCLFVGVEVFFIPVYEAKRNYWVEGFHSLWLKAFWQRHHFTSLAQVQAEAPSFLPWYHTRYRPPSLAGRTPAQMRSGCQPLRLTASLCRLIPDILPITGGRVHFIRKVDTLGHITLLNETWPIGRQWIGQYVWAIVDTAEQTLALWQKADAQAGWKHVKTRRFKLEEPVHRLLPAFRRRRARCLDHWPG